MYEVIEEKRWEVKYGRCFGSFVSGFMGYRRGESGGLWV